MHPPTQGTTEEPSASPTPTGRRVLRRPSFFTVVFTASVLIFLAVRLGPSLVGARVFAGLDVFDLFPPWSSLPGAADPVTTSTYVTDQIDVNFPAMNEVRARLLQGDLAAWSSMVAGGYALLGTINLGMLSPTRFLYFVLPTWLAPSWSKLVEIGFAGAFTYLLMRRLGASRAAAVVSGFVYPMTGFMIGWTNWTQTAVAAVIPMLFWAVERFCQERRLQDLVPVAVATALLILGGFPAVAGQALYLAAGYSVVRVFVLSRSRGRRIRGIARDLTALLGAVLLGVGISAVQLLPFVARTLGDVDLSYRAAGFYQQVPLHYMLTAIFPGSFSGNNLPSPASPMDLNAYVGGVVVILAALGLLQIRRIGRARSAAVYLALVLLLVIALLWFQGAWSDWMGQLPVLSGNPIGRIRSQIGLPAAALAGLGVDWIRFWGSGDSTRTDSPRRIEPWVGAGLAILATGLAAAAGGVLLAGRVVGTSSGVPGDVAWTIIPMTIVTILVVELARARTGRRTRLAVTVVAAAAVAVVVQAFPATSFYWPTGERSKFYASSEGIELLQQNLGHDRLATLGHAIRPNTTHYYGLRTLNGHIFAPKLIKDVFVAVDPGSFIGPTYSIFSPNVSAVAQSPGLDRYGVRYLVAQANSVQPGRPGVPVTIPGVADPTEPASGTSDLVVDGTYLTTVQPGDLRGLHVPLEVLVPGVVSVEVRDSSGALVAENSRKLSRTAGLRDVPFALALAQPADVDPSGPWQVTLRNEGAEAIATFDAEGALRVRAVRGFAAGDPADDGLSVAFAGEGMIIWERAAFLPRIRWADRAVVIEDPAERVDAVANRPATPSEVILDAPPAVALGSGAGGTGTIEIVQDDGDVVRIRTRSPEPGFVVVSDSIQRDFVASVDGVPAEVVAADHAGGAVAVPAGDHVVVIAHASAEQQVGLVVTAGSLAIAIVLLLSPRVLARVRRARSGPPGSRDD